jgi:hypothetical protein
MNMDLDTLLRDSDPGHVAKTPSSDSPEFERIWNQVNRADTQTTPTPRRTHRILFPTVALALLAAVLLVVVELWSGPGFQPARSAAATLRTLAQVARTQPSAVPKGTQWLEQKVRLSMSASILMVGKTATPDASATVNATIDEWANTNTTTCTVSNLSAVQFASPVNQSAWVAAGLLVHPTTPQYNCINFGQLQNSTVGNGAGAFDISSLPTAPALLAKQLEAGTTKIPGLNNLPFDGRGKDAGFARAAALLIGPTVGGSPAFWSGLLGAMATMNGVTSLGHVTTHAGATGLGFSAPSGLGQITLILSPSSGKLLEARNIDDQVLEGSEGPGQAFANMKDPHGFAFEGGGEKSIVRWLDPIASPTIVNSIPRSLQKQLGPYSNGTGYIRAETNPGVTDKQLFPLLATLGQLPGSPLASFSGAGNIAIKSFQVIMHGDSAEENRVEAVMKASGLFAHISQRT